LFNLIKPEYSLVWDFFRLNDIGHLILFLSLFYLMDVSNSCLELARISWYASERRHAKLQASSSICKCDAIIADQRRLQHSSRLGITFLITNNNDISCFERKMLSAIACSDLSTAAAAVLLISLQPCRYVYGLRCLKDVESYNLLVDKQTHHIIDE
jgi:hypothetical protein